jgi:hypothetical protein
MDDDQDLDVDPVRVPECHKRNGQCTCAGHSQGVCSTCGHLTYVHKMTGGCMFTVKDADGSRTCACPQVSACNPQHIP